MRPVRRRLSLVHGQHADGEGDDADDHLPLVRGAQLAVTPETRGQRHPADQLPAETERWLTGGTGMARQS